MAFGYTAFTVSFSKMRFERSKFN